MDHIFSLEKKKRFHHITNLLVDYLNVLSLCFNSFSWLLRNFIFLCAQPCIKQDFLVCSLEFLGVLQREGFPVISARIVGEKRKRSHGFSPTFFSRKVLLCQQGQMSLGVPTPTAPRLWRVGDIWAVRPGP